jgi:hypothetical protein
MSKIPANDVLKVELNAEAKEPLLPIEKKLIVGSLTLGIVLLVVLGLVNHFVPVS